jgi:hypothetical protein
MPGSVTAQFRQTPPLELALRATLAFAIALWLAAEFAPALLAALLPFYEELVHLLDAHYRIEMSLTHLTGHDRIGSDLVVLTRATPEKEFIFFGGGTPFLMDPRNVLTSSSASGLLMQPAIVIFGLLLAWPLRSWREALLRGVFGSLLLMLWLLFGVPVSIWIYFQDIPLRVVTPNEVSFLTAVGKFLLNGGEIVLGALLAAAAIAAAGWLSDGTQRSQPGER